MSFYYVCNPRDVLENTAHIIVRTNMLPPNLGMSELSPFLLGRPVILSGKVPIMIVGQGTLWPFSIHMDGCFATRAIAEGIATGMGSDVVQLLAVSCEERPVEDFVLVNVTKVIDCLDRTSSQAIVDPRNPDAALGWSSLFLTKANIPEDTHLFRIAEMEDVLVASEIGKQVLIKAGVSRDFFDANYLR